MTYTLFSKICSYSDEGRSPYYKRKHVSIKVQFAASSSIEYPLYHSLPTSPSMYVIEETQLAVDVNPGS
jgi:hypothetical protein